MKKNRICLFGDQKSAAAAHLEEELRRLGAEPIIVDMSRFPEETTLSVDATGLQADGEDLTGVDAAFIMHNDYMTPVPAWIPPQPEWSKRQKGFEAAMQRHQETRSVRASAFRLLAGICPVINDPQLYRACCLLPALLRFLEQRGIPVPPFVSGNDLEKIAYFVDRHDQKCALRRISDPPWKEVPADFSCLRDRFNDFDRFPYLVRKSLGGDRFSVLVAGENTRDVLERPEGTWRRKAGQNEALLRLGVKTLGLVNASFGLVHIECTSEGDPSIIGIDPEPDIAAIENETGIPLAFYLAELLIDSAEAHHAQHSAAAYNAGFFCSPPTGSHDSGSIRTVAHTDFPHATKRKPRIGLAGKASNGELQLLSQSLAERNATPVPVELPLFPDRRAIHECAEGGRIARETFESLDALFLRTTGFRSPLPKQKAVSLPFDRWLSLYEPYRTMVRDEGDCFPFKYAVCEILKSRIPVINPPAGQEVHRHKLWQLFHLQRLALPIPPSCAGNDPALLSAFIEAQGGPEQVVLKPLAGIDKTTLLRDNDLESALRSGPVLLQRCIRGPTIRAYIVGGTLCGAARIINRGDIDSSVGQEGVEPVTLPEEVVKTGWRAARSLGLSWTGMDFIEDTETGRYYILECNASPMFAGFSFQTGFDIAGKLADFLIGQARERRNEK